MNKHRNRLILLNIAILCILFAAIRPFQSHENYHLISPYLALGFLVIAAHLGGLLAQAFALPALTGNLLAGILLGPSVLNLISLSDISSLELINSLALSFIAITAGGELKLKNLRKHATSIFAITISHFIIVFSTSIALFYYIFTHTALLSITDPTIILSFCIFLGIVAMAKSPAATIAVLNEFRAKGPFTDLVLGVTMLVDVIILVMFAIAMAYVQSIITHTPISLIFLLELIGHLLLSVGAGLMFGYLMILFYKYIGRELTLFIVIASFISHDMAQFAGIEHMLMCMVAGFIVQNFSRQGHRMIEGIENSYLPIYVVFFSLAGASLNFSHLKAFYPAVILFVVVRLILVLIATYLGAYLSKAPPTILKYSWTGFLTNAGLTLSIVIIIENTFPDWGSILMAFVISVIAINQIVGPVLFKLGLDKSGEITRWPNRK